MGKEWDSDKGGRDKWIAWLSSIMKECLRVLKPGGHAAVWALPRTSHWTGMALELAGFEVRDCISYLYDSGRDVQAFLETLSPEQRTMLEIILANSDDTFSNFIHCFGSGFPKSLDISKAIDSHLGMEREVVGHRKVTPSDLGQSNGWNYLDTSSGEYSYTAPSSAEAKQWDGWGTATKPAAEYWWLVRKPLSEPTVAQNVLRWGVGGINVDASRIPAKPMDRFGGGGLNSPTNGFMGSTSKTYQKGTGFRDDTHIGRFPANIIHDGSEPVEAEFAKAGVRSSGAKLPVEVNNSNATVSFIGKVRHNSGVALETSTGSSSRFFYCAKPSPRERNEGLEGNRNIHPTLKSLQLMKYLITMITPKGGTVLDCFMGSGSTGKAALPLGFNFIGIEKERPYFEIAEARIRHANLGQAGEIVASEPLPVKTKPKLQLSMF